MVTHFASKKTIVSVAALLLIGATLAVPQSRTSVTRATVCVQSNGQLRMPTGGATGCGPSEQLVRWVVDGEVTDVRVGPGLVATRKDGLVNLKLDPSVLECENCNGGKVFAGYNDGPGQIPMGAPPFHEPEQIASLDVPEGDYAIFAKMELAVPELFATDSRVWCRLTAGADSDEALVVLEEANFSRFGPPWGGASRHVMKLQVVHRFETPGTVVLGCADGYTAHSGTFDQNTYSRT